MSSKTTTIIDNLQSFLDSLKQREQNLIDGRNYLYSQIDTTHYSPFNIILFQQIQELTIRLDEIYKILAGYIHDKVGVTK